MMRHLVLLAAAAAASFLPGHLLALAAVLAVVLSATMTSNTPKTRALEQRLNNIVTAQTGTNQAIRQLQQGLFTNINGGFQVQLYAQQNATLHCGTLSLWTQDSQVNLLNGISRQGRPPTVPAAPGSFSQSWCQGIVDDMNGVIASLEVMGLMT